MSPHYHVKHKYPKNDNIYRWAEGPVVNFKAFNWNVKYDIVSVKNNEGHIEHLFK